MIIKFKKHFPIFYKLLSSLYHKTGHYKLKIKKYEELIKANNVIRSRNELAIIETIFNKQFVVQNGPFKGMKYINKSSCSTLIPKLLGSYEEVIQGWVNDIISNSKYKKILDIGSAEGYYAVGFSLKIPNAKIIAYDIDDSARNNLKELINVNGVINIEIKEECNHEELNRNCEKNTLIFCDIEGFEDSLLDLEKAPNLKNVDLIIESHDCFVPNITDILINRFHETHTIKICVDYPFRINKYFTPNEFSDSQFSYMIDEERPNYMKFLFLQSINE
jgi:hypothetical protein